MKNAFIYLTRTERQALVEKLDAAVELLVTVSDKLIHEPAPFKEILDSIVDHVNAIACELEDTQTADESAEF